MVSVWGKIESNCPIIKKRLKTIIFKTFKLFKSFSQPIHLYNHIKTNQIYKNNSYI